jgi:hypothetical protein
MERIEFKGFDFNIKPHKKTWRDLLLGIRLEDKDLNVVPQGTTEEVVVSSFPLTMHTEYLYVGDPKPCDHPEEFIVPDSSSGPDDVRKCTKCGATQTKRKDEKEWPDEWDYPDSISLGVFRSSWPESLVLAMVRPTKDEVIKQVERNSKRLVLWELAAAISVAANSCERCLNALMWHYGLDHGYAYKSEQWDKANTMCMLCDNDSDDNFWKFLLVS